MKTPYMVLYNWNMMKMDYLFEGEFQFEINYPDPARPPEVLVYIRLSLSDFVVTGEKYSLLFCRPAKDSDSQERWIGYMCPCVEFPSKDQDFWRLWGLGQNAPVIVTNEINPHMIFYERAYVYHVLSRKDERPTMTQFLKGSGHNEPYTTENR